MKIVRQINSWTCLPAAVATHLYCYCTDPLGMLFKHLGHDGSEIVRDGSDPMRRLGFHHQEMFEIAFKSRYATTQIDLVPSSRPSINHEPHVFNKILGEISEERFDRHLKTSFGWISAMTRRGTGHALAYDYATIGDPTTGEIFTYQSTQDCESRGLYFMSLFRLDSMEQRSYGED